MGNIKIFYLAISKIHTDADFCIWCYFDIFRARPGK